MAKMKFLIRASMTAAFLAGAAGGAAQAQINQVLQASQQSTQEGQTTQRQIDDLADDASDMALAYRAVLQQMESQRLYLEQQRVFLRSQQNEIQSLQSQIDRVGNVGVDLIPMMREMVANLENFIQLDLPFDMQTRQDRIARLHTDLDDHELPAAERYRLILNAYEIEAAYGRGVASYVETVEVDGIPTRVNVLRIGRVALIRRFANGDLYIRHRNNSDYERVTNADQSAVNAAFRIAQEVTTPDIFLVPLPGSEVVQ